MTTPKIIDVWSQPVVAGVREKLPEVQALLKRSGRPWSQNPIGPDELVAEMDRAGVDIVFLTAWCRPSGWVITNDAVAEYTKAYPDRFVGVASADLSKPMEAVAEIHRAVTELDFKAVRIIPWLWELPPNHRLYYPLYVKCIELGIPFCCQIGHTGPLMPSDTGRPVPYIDQVLLDFPELVLVGGHIGYPWTEETVGMMIKHQNFYIDTSAYLPKMYPQALLDYMKTWGRKKVLFATNYPHLPHDKCVRGVEELGLDKKTSEAFMFRNAQRIFKL